MDKQEVEKILKLAKLEIKEDEFDEYLSQINSIVDYIGLLEEVKIDAGLEFENENIATIFSEEEKDFYLEKDSIKINAPFFFEDDNFYFSLPPVIEQ